MTTLPGQPPYGQLMLEGLLKLPENRECADCKCKSRPDLEIGLGEKLIIVFMQHVRTINDDGRSISRDLDGFPVTCSGSYEDNMVVLKQESQFAKANDCSFSRFSLQIEQRIPVLSRWLIFNRFKFTASQGVKLGPAFLLTRVIPDPFSNFTKPVMKHSALLAFSLSLSSLFYLFSLLRRRLWYRHRRPPPPPPHLLPHRPLSLLLFSSPVVYIVFSV
ncbi:hypothetical protein TEA_012196 [Camellia sinensis var. sinensis]|uniref:Uncharacterized protein n=1 Tax=Camellia sinensis var. sinensis TaxID=542762 RepID=A0A4S4DLC8_CAMSN|nr:hypothetical protein TEA_012196 [Camellia sinensis var. sinensis]